MKFTKMHGLGNDYVYINCFKEEVINPEQLARKVSSRHLGIGSDGLVLIKPSEQADCRMQMFNADGSESEMCGNAIRCVGKYVYDHHITDKSRIMVETKSGIRALDMQVTEGKVTGVTVDMGEAVVTSELPEAIIVEGSSYEFVGISVGNPHAVYFMDGIDNLDLKRIGPAFENHERFPERTNTEFVEVVDRGHIRMRVWERGSGETQACGTGASASMAASALMGLTDDTVEVSLLGGSLLIRWDRDDNHIYMTGPAVEVFHGEIEC